MLKRGGGKSKYCYVPPASPIQEFLECQNTDYACLSSALAEAQAIVGLITSVAATFLTIVGARIMNKYAVVISEE